MLYLGRAIFCLVFFFSTAQSHEPLRPTRVTVSPTIDGRLDESFWQSITPFTDFRVYAPDFGSPMSQKSEGYVAYDDQFLYFAMNCLDQYPAKMKANLSRRDEMFSDDWICINLDSFNDQQTLLGFYVNPLGVQGDSVFSNGKEDPGFDMVWQSAGARHAAGYSVEIRIPLKSIRFAKGDEVSMGVIFERHISRTSEKGTSPALDPKKGDIFLTQMQPLLFTGLKHPVLLEILPAVTYQRQETLQQGRLQTLKEGEDLSLTLKYGLTPRLVLDATYQPDFNQVEADAGQVDVNLRYNLFYDEKRPFFAEGSELFSIAGSGIEKSVSSVVHTRSIVDPVYGLKLTGKLGPRTSLASLVAQDELEDGSHADFNILRVKRSWSGDGFFGGIYTSRSTDQRVNRVLGLDGLVRYRSDSFIDYFAIGSKTEQEVGPLSLQGHAVQVDWNRNNRENDYFLGVSDISEDFQVDSGYVTRVGVTRFQGSYQPKWYNLTPVIQRLNVFFYTIQTKDKPSGDWEHFEGANTRLSVWGAGRVGLRLGYGTEIFLGQRFDIDHAVASLDHSPNKYLTYSVSYRNGDAIFYSDNPYQGTEKVAQAALTVKPSDRWVLDLRYTHYNFSRNAGHEKIFDYPISRMKLTYQGNRYLFFRAIAEHDEFRKNLVTDFLASFTYIPGTVVHLGYGSFYEKGSEAETPDLYPNRRDYREAARGYFFKASYLWRR